MYLDVNMRDGKILNLPCYTWMNIVKVKEKRLDCG